MLIVIIVMALLGTLIGWYSMAKRGTLSPVLLATQSVTTVVLVALLLSAWREWLPLHTTELGCLVYAAVICVACMALRMYSPHYGAALDLKPLYLWIPVIYVFAFTLTDHRTGLVISLSIMALFIVVSLPYLVRDIDAPDANFTVQLHVVSGALIATLYFFSRYQHRLRLAQATVAQLAWLSSTDELTKLANRRHMATVIDAELAQPARRGRGLAIMLFDIDHFKAINDRFGHAAGDAAIVALAGQAVEVFRGVGILGRWGGDEFVALVRDMESADAMRLANLLCRCVAASELPGGRPITVSCGVTMAADADSIDSLLQRADAALYAAKRAGRNRVEGILEPVDVREPQPV